MIIHQPTGRVFGINYVRNPCGVLANLMDGQVKWLAVACPQLFWWPEGKVGRQRHSPEQHELN
jgi:hypothetical protein